MIRSYFAAATLSAFALLAVGCHRERPRAYRQPPPPAVDSGAGAPASQNPSRSGEANAANAAPQPDTHGRPVSSEIGLASWYGPPYSGRKGADGTIYDQNAMTAAHLTLPLGTVVRVTNLTTNQSAVVRITDRGPFVRGRIIDLSLAAAKAIGVYRAGVARVRVEAFSPATPAPAGRWCVQVGAFSREKDAIKLRDQLSRRYTTAKVIEFAGPTGHWVRVNPLEPNLAHANEIAGNIRTPDPAALPYVVRTN